MKKISLIVILFSFCFLGFASASTDGWCYNFKKDLKLGNKGEDVNALRLALIKEGVYKSEWTSSSFDIYIAAAVMDFQNKYSSEILIPNGITQPTGIVGKSTRKKLNEIFACTGNTNTNPTTTTNEDKNAIIAKAIDYINKYLAQGITVTLGKIDNNVYPFYKFEAMSNGSPVTVYASTDGKKMMFQEVDISKEPTITATTSTEIKKSDKPTVELFVMSHCPYGTQIEKGIIPVIEALGEKIDFSLKFCNYAMHGESELKEELNQYCIQKEQKDKLLPYLKCFLKEGKSEECIVSAGIDKTKLTTCTANAEKEFNVMANFKDNKDYIGDFPSFNIFKADNEKYGVQGSPTLIINGVQVQSNRDSNSLLKSICSAFNSNPDICSKNISSEAPAVGFGTGTTTTTTTGGCGN
ncbi:MAG: peptidoglycan-binding domain-containing protein [Candidatus Paceibacterota bacterium]